MGTKELKLSSAKPALLFSTCLVLIGSLVALISISILLQQNEGVVCPVAHQAIEFIKSVKYQLRLF